MKLSTVRYVVYFYFLQITLFADRILLLFAYSKKNCVLLKILFFSCVHYTGFAEKMYKSMSIHQKTKRCSIRLQKYIISSSGSYYDED